MRKAFAWSILLSVFVIFFVVIAFGFFASMVRGTFAFGYNIANDTMIKIIGRL